MAVDIGVSLVILCWIEESRFSKPPTTEWTINLLNFVTKLTTMVDCM